MEEKDCLAFESAYEIQKVSLLSSPGWKVSEEKKPRD